MNKIVMISNYSLNNKFVVDLSIKNHYEYCSKFGIDFLYTISDYSSYNNFDELLWLLNRYDTVITVGTDILFTNFNKDIRDFIDYRYDIIIQKEHQTPYDEVVNGDFILWNKTNSIKQSIYFLKSKVNEQNSTQDNICKYKDVMSIKILKLRTIQSICRYFNETKNQDNALWQNGDFSVHCHHPGEYANNSKKQISMKQFMQENSHCFPY